MNPKERKKNEHPIIPTMQEQDQESKPFSGDRILNIAISIHSCCWGRTWCQRIILRWYLSNANTMNGVLFVGSIFPIHLYLTRLVGPCVQAILFVRPTCIWQTSFYTGRSFGRNLNCRTTCKKLSRIGFHSSRKGEIIINREDHWQVPRNNLPVIRIELPCDRCSNKSKVDFVRAQQEINATSLSWRKPNE